MKTERAIESIDSPVLRARRIEALRALVASYRDRALHPQDHADIISRGDLLKCAVAAAELVRELESGKNPPRACRVHVRTDDLDERGEMLA
jgi:hypothetical protein